MVLELLSVQELRTYGLVCERTHEAVKQYLKNLASVTRLLKAFIDQDSVSAFRKMQRATGAIIGGSAALQFFTRQEYSSSDLDLYVHVSSAGKVFCALNKMRCSKDPKRKLVTVGQVAHQPYASRAIKDVVDFTTPTSRKIQVIVSRRRPVDLILEYHSSKRRTLASSFVVLTHCRNNTPYLNLLLVGCNCLCIVK